MNLECIIPTASLFFAALAYGIEIVLPSNPAPTEITAHKELIEFIPKTAESIAIDGTAIKSIHVGDTPQALNAGFSRASMKDDSFVIRRINDTIVINGGGTRGILYGIYGFLEDVCGVRFFSPACIHIPRKRPISVKSVDKDGSFFFQMRDIYTSKLLPPDGGRTAIANGLSRDGDRPITKEFGGAFDYGPPYSCHTFDHYIPAAKYLKTNPEYFSLKDGKRVGGQTKGQLCLTNPDVKRLFTELLLKNIRETTEKARQDGIAPPAIYDVSQNDNGSFCQCPDCSKLIAAENASGYMLAFVNSLAESVKKEFPFVKLQTFAYFNTFKPPKTTKAADNVIVRICNTSGDQISGAPSNPQLVESLDGWQSAANEIYVWEYGITYGDSTGLPYPSEFHFPEVFRFYAGRNAKGMFWELEAPDRSDLWELKYHMLSKYMANPFRDDLDALLDDFHSSYFGPAGKFMAEWRRLLDKAASAPRPLLGWVPTNGDFEFITWPVMEQSQSLFAAARIAVGGDTELLYRINRAAMGMDRLLGYEATRRFINEFTSGGKDRNSFPVDVHAVRKRFITTWNESLRRNGGMNENTRKSLMARFENFDKVPYDYPEEPLFAAVPHVDVTPGDMPLVLGREMAVIQDDTSPIGATMMIDADTNRKTYKFPMTFGMFNKSKAQGIVSKVFQKEKFVPEKYQWVAVEDILLPPDDNCYLWLTNSWKIQIPLANLRPLDRSRRITANIHVKFSGDLYYGDGKPSRIFIDRVVITQGKDKQ